MLASWMGGERVAAGVDILNRAGIPTFAFPDDAARAFCDMGRFADNLRALYETPVPRTGDDGHPAEVDGDHRRRARRGPDAARRGRGEGGARELRHPGRADARRRATRTRRSRRRARSASRSRSSSGRATSRTRPTSAASSSGSRTRPRWRARSTTSAAAAVAKGGAGVLPGRHRAADDRSQRGPRADPGQHASIAQLGPVLLFGAGGELVEVLRDRALALPPLTTTLARRLIDETRIARALRGRPRPPARGSRRRSRRCWCASAISSPSSAGSARSTSTRCWRRRRASSRWTRASSCTIPRSPPTELPRPAIRPYPTEYVWTRDVARRRARSRSGRSGPTTSRC